MRTHEQTPHDRIELPRMHGKAPPTELRKETYLMLERTWPRRYRWWRRYNWSERRIICPNPSCHYQGETLSRPLRNPIVAAMLLLLWLVPGLLYLWFFPRGHQHYCPRCCAEVRFD